MNISLPDTLLAAVAQKAAEAGFRSPDEYISDLIKQDLDTDYYLRQALAGEGNPASVTQETLDRRKREIHTLLIEGLESGPAAPMTPGDWQALRQRVEIRLGRPLA